MWRSHRLSLSLSHLLGLWAIETVQDVSWFLFLVLFFLSFSGTSATTKETQLDRTSGMMPLLGQPSFCLKLTSSLVLFSFLFFVLSTAQDDLTVKKKKKCLHPAPLLPPTPALGVSVSSLLSCIMIVFFLSLVKPLCSSSDIFPATKATLAARSQSLVSSCAPPRPPPPLQCLTSFYKARARRCTSSCAVSAEKYRRIKKRSLWSLLLDLLWFSVVGTSEDVEVLPAWTTGVTVDAVEQLTPSRLG